MTSHTDTQGEQEALRAAILSFDLSRADTCIDAVTGKITKDEAHSQLERDVSHIIGIIEAHTSQAIELASVRAQIEVIEKIRPLVGYEIEPDFDPGDATYGDSRHDHNAVVYGENVARGAAQGSIENVLADLKAQLTQLEGKQ